MIEGMFVFLIGAASGVVATKLYMKKTPQKFEDVLFDPKNYLTTDGKYFTNRGLDDEGDK